MIRWAKLVEILFTLRTNIHPSRVLPPVLTVEYAEALLPPTSTLTTAEGLYEAGGGEPPSATFRASYTMQMDGTTSILSILLFMGIVCWVLGWFSSIFFRMRRNQRQARE